MTDKREEMELRIEDPAFILMRVEFNEALRKTVEQMDIRDVDEASVSLKIKILRSEVSVPHRDDKARKLKMDYKIATQLILKADVDGGIDELDQFELDYDSKGNMQLIRVIDPQHKIDEYI